MKLTLTTLLTLAVLQGMGQTKPKVKHTYFTYDMSFTTTDGCKYLQWGWADIQSGSPSWDFIYSNMVKRIRPAKMLRYTAVITNLKQVKYKPTGKSEPFSKSICLNNQNKLQITDDMPKGLSFPFYKIREGYTSTGLLDTSSIAHAIKARIDSLNTYKSDSFNYLQPPHYTFGGVQLKIDMVVTDSLIIHVHKSQLHWLDDSTVVVKPKKVT